MLAGPLPLRWYACYKYFHYFVLVVAKIKSKKRINSELINVQKKYKYKKDTQGSAQHKFIYDTYFTTLIVSRIRQNEFGVDELRNFFSRKQDL